MTVGQANAGRSAATYLKLTAFSRSGLIEQLKYEGYTLAEATYGVDSLKVNWNAQAVAKAKEYLNLTAFSRSGLIEQLEYEGFTAAQATYGANGVGL